MAVKPLFSGVPQFEDSSGNPYTSARLFFYAAGSSTKQNTYTDSTGGTAHSNPITLNSSGYPVNSGNIAGIWGTTGQTYKIGLAIPGSDDPPAAFIWTIDNVSPINDTSVSVDEWSDSGLTPTYVSATSFTLVGDQTTEFHKGRRLKITDSGGTKYVTITASTFGATTSVTVAGDALATPTSAVSYSVLRATNPSASPEMIYRKGTAVASAATCDIWGIFGDYVHITGTTGITSFGTAPYAGAERTLIFDSALTITHNATTLQCPGGFSLPVQAGDRVVVRADTTANMIITSHTQALVNSTLIEIAMSGRLTLTTATPVTTADVTGATTVYFSPMAGRFTELSQTTADNTKSPAAVGASSNYDVFLWMDSGTLRATRGPAWSSATARGTGAGTTELTASNGVYLNAVAITNGPGASAGIYLGTIRSDGSSQINDSMALRHVWNMYNRRPRPMRVTDTTDSWNYGTATIRQARATATNQLDLVKGLDEDAVDVAVLSHFSNDTSAGGGSVGIGLDSTTAYTTGSLSQFGVTASNVSLIPVAAEWVGFTGIGRHFISWNETGNGTGTQTWYGDNGATNRQSGIHGITLG